MGNADQIGAKIGAKSKRGPPPSDPPEEKSWQRAFDFWYGLGVRVVVRVRSGAAAGRSLLYTITICQN